MKKLLALFFCLPLAAQQYSVQYNSTTKKIVAPTNILGMTFGNQTLTNLVGTGLANSNGNLVVDGILSNLFGDPDMFQSTNANLTAWSALATSAKQNAFTTGAGVTNQANVLSANLAAGTGITFATNANGQVEITSTATSGGGGTNMMVATLDPNTTISPTFNIAGLSTTAASCRRLTIRIAMTNNVTTVSNPAGTLIDGDVMVMEFIQDGTGSRTVTGWESKYAFGTDITGITLTTTASKRDFATFVYNSTADKWYAVGFVRGY